MPRRPARPKMPKAPKTAKVRAAKLHRPPKAKRQKIKAGKNSKGVRKVITRTDGE